MTTPQDFIVSADVPVYPQNAQAAIATAFEALLPGMPVILRSLRPTDPNECIGVYPVIWQPESDSTEILGSQRSSSPTISRYRISIEGFIKDGDELRGLARHSVLAKLIRTMVDRSDGLALSLRSLTVPLMGSTERLMRYGVASQRYISSEISGAWLYLSLTDFWFDTETY